MLVICALSLASLHIYYTYATLTSHQDKIKARLIRAMMRTKRVAQPRHAASDPRGVPRTGWLYLMQSDPHRLTESELICK